MKNLPLTAVCSPWAEGPTVVTGGHFKEDYAFTPSDIRFTTRNGKLYAIALGVPADGKLLVRSLAKIPGDEAANAVTDVLLLGSNSPAAWSQSTNGLAVQLPPQLPSQYTVALEIVGTQLKPAPIEKTN
jgi:alpha-L-fucosidase